MNIKATLYIGSNNDTKELEYQKAIAVVAGIFKGFTVAYHSGYWEGVQEDSMTISVLGEDSPAFRHDIVKASHVIKEALKQDAVLVEYTTVEAMLE
jgi:hypothetical protein